MPAFATLILCCSIASWIADRSCGFIFSISSIAANPRSARTRAPASKVHRPSPNSSRTAAAVLWTKIPFATKACESLTERSKTVLSSEDDLTSISLTGSQRTSPEERSRRNSNRLGILSILRRIGASSAAISAAVPGSSPPSSFSIRCLEPVDELKEGLSCDRFCPSLHRDASARVASVGLRWTETQETADIVKMWAGPRDEVYVRVWPAGLHALEDFFLARMIETD